MTKKAKSRKRNNLLNKVHHPDAAGIDIGAEDFYVAVGNDRLSTHNLERTVECFSSFNKGIREAVDWLKDLGIQTVAMETTGNYWVAIYDYLSEAGFEIFLVNARHCKGLPGRKTDVCDAAWLQQLHTAGLLKNSYVLQIDQRALRYLIRERSSLIRDAARIIQKMQKALTEMNVQLHHVIKDISGMSGRRIIEAIIDGQRDLNNLAGLRDNRCRASHQEVIDALDGNFRSEYVFILKQAYKHLNQIEQNILEMEDEIDSRLEKAVAQSEAGLDKNSDEPKTSTSTKSTRNYTLKDAPRKRANTVAFSSYGEQLFGVDLTTIPGVSEGLISQLIAELGDRDQFLKSFKTSKHFTSWLGLCPDNRITGSKVQGRGKTRKVENPLASSFRLSANSLYRSSGSLGGYCAKMKSRLGKPEGITATAHKLAKIVFTLIAKGEPYNDEVDKQIQKQNLERQVKAIQRKAAKLGLKLIEQLDEPNDKQQLAGTL